MEFGPYQMQIFVSLVLILGASVVALICDYLKGHNEQLRELAVELKVRREESQKMVDMLSSKDSPLQIPVMATPAESVSPAMQYAGPEPERVLSRAAAPAGRDATFTARPANPTESKRLSRDAMVAIVRGSMKAGVRDAAPTESVKPAPAETAVPAAPPADVLQQVVAAADSRRKAMEEARPASSVKSAGGGKKDWNSLLAARRKEAAAQRETLAEPQNAGLLDAVVAATSSGESGGTELSLSSELHDASQLKLPAVKSLPAPAARATSRL